MSNVIRPDRWNIDAAQAECERLKRYAAWAIRIANAIEHRAIGDPDPQDEIDSLTEAEFFDELHALERFKAAEDRLKTLEALRARNAHH